MTIRLIDGLCNSFCFNFCLPNLHTNKSTSPEKDLEQTDTIFNSGYFVVIFLFSSGCLLRLALCS